ncbi:hypothetical protein ABZ635_00195 [Nocardiopsis sp. NPDC007018]|uniref:hypothetical protein n=1 Tax=Nocardiopsis sp. NPDC007018 TaxID=3155721 RepID=UPI0033C9BD0D
MDNALPTPGGGDNGTIDTTPPAARSPRLLDPLLRFQVRAQNDPGHARRVAFTGVLSLTLLTVLLGLLFGVADHPAVWAVLALVGVAAGLPLFLMVVTAFVHLMVFRVPLPADTRPADLRAARRVLRSRTLTGVPEVDRVARALAAQVLGQRLWPSALMLAGFSVLNLFNALNRYASDGGWSGSAVFLVVSVLMALMVAFAVAHDLLAKRRARDLAMAYDARPGGTVNSEPSRGLG